MSSSDKFKDKQDGEDVWNGEDIWKKILDSTDEESPGFDVVLSRYIADVERTIDSLDKGQGPMGDPATIEQMQSLLKEFKSTRQVFRDIDDDENDENPDDLKWADEVDESLFDDDDDDLDKIVEDENEDDDFDNDDEDDEDEEDEEDEEDGDNALSWTPEDEEEDEEENRPTAAQLKELRKRIADGEYHLKSEYAQMILDFLKDQEDSLPHKHTLELLNEARTTFEELIAEGSTQYYDVLGRIKLRIIYMDITRRTGLISPESLNEFLAEYEQIHSDSPNETEITELLASAYRIKGEVCEKNGSPSAALEPRLKSVKLLESALSTGETSLWSPYASALAELGNCYVQLGDLKLAKNSLLESIAALDEYAQEDPIPAQAEKVNLLGRLHDVYRSLDDDHQALKTLEEALEYQNKLYKDDRLMFWYGYVQLLMAKSDLLNALNREDESLQLQEQIRQCCQLMQEDIRAKVNADTLMETPNMLLAQSWRNTGRIHISTSCYRDAHEAFAQSLAALRKVLKHQRAYKDSRFFMLTLVVDEMSALSAERNIEAASNLIRKSISLMEKMMEIGDHSADVMYAHVLHQYCYILYCQDKTDEILPVMDKCVAHWESLVEEKGMWHFQSAYAAALGERGMYYFRVKNDTEQGLRDLTRAQSIFSSDVEDDDGLASPFLYLKSMNDVSAILLSLKLNDQAIEVCKTLVNRLYDDFERGKLAFFPQLVEALRSLATAVEAKDGPDAAAEAVTQEILRLQNTLKERITLGDDGKVLAWDHDTPVDFVQAGPVMFCSLDAELVLLKLKTFVKKEHQKKLDADNQINETEEITEEQTEEKIEEEDTDLFYTSFLSEATELIDRILDCDLVPELAELFDDQLSSLTECISGWYAVHDDVKAEFTLIDRMIQFYGHHTEKGKALLDTQVPVYHEMKLKHAIAHNDDALVDAAGKEYLDRCCPQANEGQTTNIIRFIDTLSNWSGFCGERGRWSKAEAVALEFLPLLETMTANGVAESGLRLGNTLFNLAGYLYHQGKSDVALNYYKRSAQVYQNIPGGDKDVTVMVNIGDCMRLAGLVRSITKKEGTRQCYEQAVNAYEAALALEENDTELIFNIAELHFLLVFQYLKFDHEEGDAIVSHLQRTLELLDRNPPEPAEKIMELRLATLTELFDAIPRSNCVDTFEQYFALIDQVYDTMDQELRKDFLFKWLRLKTDQFLYYFWNDQFEESAAIADTIEDMGDHREPSENDATPEHLNWYFYYPRVMQLIAEGHFWSARRIIRKYLAIVQKYRTAPAQANQDAQADNESSASDVALLHREMSIQLLLVLSYYKQNRYRKVQNLIQTLYRQYKFALSDITEFSYAVILASCEAWSNNHRRRYAMTIQVSRNILNEFSKKKRFLPVSDERFLAQLLCDQAEAYWRLDQVEMAMCDCDEACQALAPFAHKGFFFIDILLLRVFLLRARLAAECDLLENTREDLTLAAKLLETIPPNFRTREVQTLRADFEFLNSWLDKDDKN